MSRPDYSVVLYKQSSLQGPLPRALYKGSSLHDMEQRSTVTHCTTRMCRTLLYCTALHCSAVCGVYTKTPYCTAQTSSVLYLQSGHARVLAKASPAAACRTLTTSIPHCAPPPCRGPSPSWGNPSWCTPGVPRVHPIRGSGAVLPAVGPAVLPASMAPRVMGPRDGRVGGGGKRGEGGWGDHELKDLHWEQKWQGSILGTSPGIVGDGRGTAVMWA